MTMRILPLILLAAACPGEIPVDSDTGEGPVDTGERWRHECWDPAPLPVTSTVLQGFTGAEDRDEDVARHAGPRHEPDDAPAGEGRVFGGLVEHRVSGQ